MNSPDTLIVKIEISIINDIKYHTVYHMISHSTRIMQEINLIIYFGAGVHFECVTHYPHAYEFVFIDVHPNSESNNIFYEPDYYRHTFIENLLINGIKHNIVLKDSRDMKSYCLDNDSTLLYRMPTLLTFINNTINQIIKYYVSTNIKSYIFEYAKKDLLRTILFVIFFCMFLY